MEFRSKSGRDGRMEMEGYEGRGPPPSGLHDLRCYSVTNMPSGPTQKEVAKVKMGRVGCGPSSSSKGGWGLSDPELQRKKRVASYKVYAVEGKVKGSFRKSFRWLKDRYTQVVYGSR